MSNNVTNLINRTSPENEDALFASAKRALVLAGVSAEPMNTRQRAILDKLSDEVFALHDKGFDFLEIAAVLRRCGIELDGSVIEQYFKQSQSRRLATCERLISDCVNQNAIAERAAVIEESLRNTLAGSAGAFFLTYQPQVDMNSGCVVGAEALLRWNAGGVVVPPGEFIAIAESSGLIVPVGEWVLREACREAKRWQSLGLGGERGIKMSVNLSAKQFSETLPDMVHGLLCDVGLPTNMLGLEITESVLVGPGALPILQQLRDTGVQLAIDDFGTGYSCLAELQEMPLETIKIDRAFVQHLGEKQNSSVMVEIIINLANKLGMGTVAEGVETADQARHLLSLGCSVCQGFLYAKPLTADEFVAFAMRAADRASSGGVRSCG